MAPMSVGGEARVRLAFLAGWAVLALAKLWLLWRLPPFVDEAFYAWEAAHPAWAYSDLPGMTAWLVWFGRGIVEEGVPGLRLPFLALGLLIPWQVLALSRRWFGAASGWQAGLLALLLPLSAVSGVLALPDVPLVFAALLCIDAVARLLSRFSWLAALQLAVGLALGGFTHYRFAAVVLAGALGLLLSAPGRSLLRDPRLWPSLAVGAAAWWPLLQWNLQHGAAGVSFQLLERHPWRFQIEGALWPLVQAAVLTPGLLVLLLATLREAWRRWREQGEAHWALLLGAAGAASVGFWPLAFFVDSERLSLHWPHAGWLLLVVAAPLIWRRWSPVAKAAVLLPGLLGPMLALGWLATAAVPSWRAQLADSAYYPQNFAGWQELAAAVADELCTAPETRIVADNFKVGAQLALALRIPDSRLAVLPHPLNTHHGRAEQLRLWGLLQPAAQARGEGSALLVVEDTARPLKERLQAYQMLAREFDGLPPPRVLNVDHGRKRFLLYRLQEPRMSVETTPALAWIDAPAAGETIARRIEARGWAFKDGSGLSRVALTLDGQVVAEAQYGLPMPWVAAYWQGSRDPQHPDVGFRAELDLSAYPPGRYWLGLVLYGRDGSVEPWPAQPVRLR